VQLDTLVDEALRANTDLAAANAALKAAHETWLATRGILLPTVDGALGTSRNKSSQYLSPVLNSTTFNYGLQTAQLNVGYQLDVFGLNRRTVEQSHAQYDMQVYQTQAARISLINNVVAAAFLEASLRAQLAAQDRMIAIQRQTLDILHRQRAAGQIAGADVLAQDAALAQSMRSISTKLRFRVICRCRSHRSSCASAPTFARQRPICMSPAQGSASRLPTACRN